MDTTHPTTIFFAPQNKTMRALCEKAMPCLVDHFSKIPQTDAATPTELATSLSQFFDILGAVDNCKQNIASTEDMPDMANHGLHLIDELNKWAAELQCHDASDAFKQLTIALAVWATEHNFLLSHIHTLVEAISQQANQTQDTQFLSKLSDISDSIISAIAPNITEDADKSAPERPWRVLNLNHGIITTRSLDTKRMELAFERLLYRLPDDAAHFFAEGMKQMDIIDYPENVREVIKNYYQLTNQPTLQ